MQGRKTFQPQIVITNFPIWHCSISIRWHQPDFNIPFPCTKHPQITSGPYLPPATLPSKFNRLHVFPAGWNRNMLFDISYRFKLPRGTTPFQVKVHPIPVHWSRFSSKHKKYCSNNWVFKRHLSSKKYYVKGSYLYLADPGFWNFYSKGTHYSVKRKPAIPWNWIVKVSWSSTHPKTQSSWPQRLPIYLQSAHTTQSLWVSYDNGKGKISGDLSFPTY
jgi:hypothetical protein